MARLRPHLFALGAYAAAAAAVFHAVVRHPGSRMAVGGRSDPGIYVWYLEWVARSLVEVRNPLLTTHMYAPEGTNLMWNTALLLPGFVVAPITLAFGPIVSTNLLFVAAPALTAWTAWLWLRRHASHWLGPFAGGAFVGFAGYQAGHMTGHLNLSLLPFIPLVLYLLEDLLWRDPPRGRLRTGVLLGAALAAQGLVTEEVVVLLALGVFLALLCALALRPGPVVGAVRAALPGGAVAVAVFVALLAVPVGYQLFGPLRAPGVSHAQFAALPRDVLFPTSHYAIHQPDADATLLQRRTNTPYESGSFLGPLLLTELAVAVLLLRRRWEVVAAVGVGVLGFLLSLGRSTGALGFSPGRPLGPILELPLLRQIVAPRFSLVTDLAVGLVLAIAVDRAVRLDLVRRSRGVAMGGLVLLVATAVTLAPAPPAGDLGVVVPPWFRSPALRSVPEGSTVVLLPAPPGSAHAAMLWQAVAHQRFRMVGGYAYARRDGVLLGTAPPDPITVLGDRVAAGGPAPTPEEVAAARSTLRSLGATRVLVAVDEDPNGGWAAAATAVLGPGAPPEGGVQIWSVEGI